MVVYVVNDVLVIGFEVGWCVVFELVFYVVVDGDVVVVVEDDEFG